MKIRKFNEDIEYVSQELHPSEFEILKNHEFKDYFLDMMDLDGWDVEIYKKDTYHLVRFYSKHLDGWFVDNSRSGFTNKEYLEKEYKTLESKKIMYECMNHFLEIEGFSISTIHKSLPFIDRSEDIPKTRQMSICFIVN